MIYLTDVAIYVKVFAKCGNSDSFARAFKWSDTLPTFCTGWSKNSETIMLFFLNYVRSIYYVTYWKRLITHL